MYLGIKEIITLGYNIFLTIYLEIISPIHNSSMQYQGFSTFGFQKCIFLCLDLQKMVRVIYYVTI